MWNVYSDRGIDKTLEFTYNLNNDKSQQLKVLKNHYNKMILQSLTLVFLLVLNDWSYLL